MINKAKIIENFHKVKSLGYVKSTRKNNTGIGKTFEDYIGVVENNIREPDLFGYEIKSQRELSNSYVTLFTLSPTFPPKANAILKDRFGTPYEENKTLKKLHTSMFVSRPNTYCNKYSFQLLNNKDEEKIYIVVSDLNTEEIIDQSTYYSYDVIKRTIEQKLNKLFFVTASQEIRDGDEYFYFNKAEIYTEPTFENFINLLDNGQIMYDIRIGSYKSGKNFGKAHDHGSGFRIKGKDICKLYSIREEVE